MSDKKQKINAIIAANFAGLTKSTFWDSVTTTIIQDFMTQFEYQGVDLEKILNTLVSATPTATNNSAVVDIRDMAMIYALRGNNIGSIRDSVDGAAKELVTQLIACYNIQNHARVGNKISRDAVTLARIGLCFPILFCSVMKFINNFALGPSDVVSKMNLRLTAVVPKEFCTPIFSSVIPSECVVSITHGITKTDYRFTEDSKEILINAALVYQMYLSNILVSKNKTPSKTLDQVRGIIQGTQSNSITNDVAKVQFLLDIKVLKFDDTAFEVVPSDTMEEIANGIATCPQKTKG